MAFPQVVSTAESARTSVGTDHDINLPPSIVAGNLLLVFFAKGSSAATTVDALAGWDELIDEAGVARGLCILYRVADGTEGATITLTLSGGSNKSASIAYQISGAEDPATQPPELSTVATGTSTAPDATTCTPTGGAKDYLWISFFSLAGEEADDDTWCNSAPASFGGLLQKTAGVAGTNIGVELATATRELNAASLDAGAFNVDVSFAWRAYTMAVHPEPPPTPTATTVARLSLEGGSSPTDPDAEHTIAVRARKTSGAGTVTLSAACYEGANNRSGNLTTSALTTSLADYTLPFSTPGITSYSNLELRVWADSSTGDTVDVEVAEIWLETPPVGTIDRTLTPGTSTETAQTLSVTHTHFRTATAAAETDAAQAANVDKRVTITAAASTETAQPVTYSQANLKTLTPAAETDAAQTLVVLGAVTITAAAETDAAQTPNVDKRKAITAATSTETAQTANVDKQVAIVAASETDVAGTVIELKQLVPAVEMDEAQNLDYEAGFQAFNLTPAVEADAAQTLSVDKPIHKTLTPASEADAAQTVTYSQAGAVTIVPAEETDVAQALSVSKPADFDLTPAAETDSAQQLQAAHLRNLTPATSAEAAHTLTHAKTAVLVAVAETDAAQALTVVKTIFKTLGFTEETDAAATLVVTGGASLVTVFYDRPGPFGGADSGSPTSTDYDRPTPSKVLV